MAPIPKPSKSTPATAAALASSNSTSGLPPVLPSSSQSASVSIRQTRQRLEQQLAEHEKLLHESKSGIGKNVLIGQISQIKDDLRDLDQQQQQQRRDDPLERLRSLEREYRSSSASSSTSSRTLDPMPSTSTIDLLPLPPAPLSSITPTKRRSKVPNADRRNTDIEFATEIGQGLLIEVRKMQTLLQQKEEQLSQLEIQKTDLERAVEAMAKQLRQREETHERLKEETWDLEVAKQELIVSVTELQQNLQKSTGEQARVVRQMNNLKAEMEKMRDREEKFSQQLETTKARHEQDMGAMRRHGAQLQREKADQKKEIDALTSELTIAKAQSRIQKRSHVDLYHQSQQQQQQAQGQSPLAGEAVVNADTTDYASSNADIGNNANTNDHSPDLPNHKVLEIETLKSSLAHAHRMVSNLRSNLHREKQEKFEFKKLLAESQEAIEQMQNEDMWVDRPSSQQQQQKPPSSKVQKQTRNKGSGKHRRKAKGGVSQVGWVASASASNKEEDDSTEYCDDEDDVLEESEYSSGGDEEHLDEDEGKTMMIPPHVMMGLSLADQLKTATQIVNVATQTEQDIPEEAVVIPQPIGEELSVHTDTLVPAIVVMEGKEFGTQTDTARAAKTETVCTQADVEKPGPKIEKINVQTEDLLAPTLHDDYTQTDGEHSPIRSQDNVPRQPATIWGEYMRIQTSTVIPTATAESTETSTQTDVAVSKGGAICTQIALVNTNEGRTHTYDTIVEAEEVSTKMDSVIIVGEEIRTQTDVIPQPVIAPKEFCTQTTLANSEETSTQTAKQKHFSAQSVVAEAFGAQDMTSFGKHSEHDVLVLSSSSLVSHQIHQAPVDWLSTSPKVLASTVTPHHDVAPIDSNPTLSDGPMFITAQVLPLQQYAVTTLSDATQTPSHNPPTMTALPMSTQQKQQQHKSTTMSNFDLPDIPIVSITGFDSRPQPMTAVAAKAAGAEGSTEMITRAEADAMVAAAVQAVIKPYLDNNRVKEGKEAAEHLPQRPVNGPPSVLLSKATERLSTTNSSRSGGEKALNLGTAYVNTQTMTYPTSQQQQRHHRHQRRDSDSSASTAPTVDHCRPSFSSMQVNEAVRTANQHGISDSGAIGLITQTMIGDWLWKYTRKTVGSGISERRHKRFFWIHPYTRTLYWSTHAPGVDGKESKAKSALIESITPIPEHIPFGAANVSMLIQTPGRLLRITAPDTSRHEVWYESLSYLMERANAAAGDHESKKSNSSVDPQYITPSLSTNSLLNKPSFPRLRPTQSISSFAGSVSSTTTTGSNSSRRMIQRQQPTIQDYDDDDDDEAFEDVRMCCNGKHHVSKLEKDQHRSPTNSNPHRHFHT